MVVSAVIFDVGETLVDETRYWETIADAVEVPRLTFMGVLGGTIERGDPHGAVLDVLEVDAPAALPPLVAADLYPDALPCLAELRSRGYALGLAGNQPSSTEAFLREAWGYLHSLRPEATEADVRIDSLTELPGALA